MLEFLMKLEVKVELYKCNTNQKLKRQVQSTM